MFKRLVSPLLIGAALAAVSTAQAASLEVRVEGLKPLEGQVLLAVFDQAETWLRGKPLKGALIKVEGDSVTVRFDELPEGASVAVSAVHDLNGNGRMDKNAIGMPTEPYGFSNKAVGNFGPPSFEAAKIVVSGAAKTTLNLN